MKYLVAPSYQMAEYWATQMNLKKNEYKIICRPEHTRGMRFKASEVVFVEEEPFDYPERQSDPHRKRYNEVVSEMRGRMIMDI